jgi:arsenate reductase (thioredoxin)
MKILILCTGNSCRSQMAEYFLKSFDKRLEVVSAGTRPASRVNPFTVRVMSEAGIAMDGCVPKHVDQFLAASFDYLITVCDNANETCPVFTGQVHHRLHMGFEDPAAVNGTEEKVLAEHRRIRDQIRMEFREFYDDVLCKGL